MSTRAAKANQMPDITEMRFRLIQLGLRHTGRTMSQVARDLRVSRSMVSHVAKGRRTSKRVQRALARAAGEPYANLWGKASR